MLRSRAILAALLGSSAFVACQMHRPVCRGMPPGASTVCVFDIRGVRAFVRDTSDGMDLTFTVVGGEGDELRRRAHAALSGAYKVRPETEAIERRVHATIHDEPEGLTINVKPNDPTDLDNVRMAIRDRMNNATSDDCH